jgi:plastocyanin
MKFQPADLAIKKGDTVTWINKDFVDHDVTEEKSKAWKSSLLKPGKKYSRVINASTEYFCSIHVVMKGKLKVN